MFYFSDSFGLEDFFNFFIDCLLPFWGETSSFLFDGFEGGTDVHLVCDYYKVNSPISSRFQANTYILCFKKWIRRSLTSLANLDPM